MCSVRPEGARIERTSASVGIVSVVPLRRIPERASGVSRRTGPVPSAVRSSVASWMTTNSPDSVRWTSSSTASTSSASTLRKPVSEFSGQRLRAPRWPMIWVMGKSSSAGLADGWIELVAQPVANERDREGRQHDDESRGEHDPRGGGEIFAAKANHVAEARFRWLDAEAKEGEAAFHKDDLGKGECHRDDQRGGDVWQDVAEIDA